MNAEMEQEVDESSFKPSLAPTEATNETDHHFLLFEVVLSADKGSISNRLQLRAERKP
jgi:hypothetical protein